MHVDLRKKTAYYMTVSNLKLNLNEALIDLFR